MVGDGGCHVIVIGGRYGSGGGCHVSVASVEVNKNKINCGRTFVPAMSLSLLCGKGRVDVPYPFTVTSCQ